MFRILHNLESTPVQFWLSWETKTSAQVSYFSGSSSGSTLNAVRQSDCATRSGVSPGNSLSPMWWHRRDGCHAWSLWSAKLRWLHMSHVQSKACLCDTRAMVPATSPLCAVRLLSSLWQLALRVGVYTVQLPICIQRRILSRVLVTSPIRRSEPHNGIMRAFVSAFFVLRHTVCFFCCWSGCTATIVLASEIKCHVVAPVGLLGSS